MEHPNKNRLLEYFYRESSEQNFRKTQVHLQSCVSCREHVSGLKVATETLNIIPQQKPQHNTFALILKGITVNPQKSFQKRPAISVIPYFQIAAAIPFILAILYFIQSKLTTLSLWLSLEELWIVQILGSFGLVTVLFFCIGSFLTLSIAPILLFDLEKKNNINQAFKFSWR